MDARGTEVGDMVPGKFGPRPIRDDDEARAIGFDVVPRKFGLLPIRDDEEARTIGFLAEPPGGSKPTAASAEASSPAAAAGGQCSSTLCATSFGASETLDTDPELEAAADAWTEGDLSSKIKAFQDQREEERRRMFRVILVLCLRIFAVGASALGAGYILRYALPESHIPGPLLILAYSTIMLTLVVGSCCPYDLFDFDDVCCKSPKSLGTVLFFTSIVNLAEVRYFPHLPVVKLLCIVLIGMTTFSGVCRLRLPRWWPSITTVQSWYFSFDGISWAGIFFFHGQNDWLAIAETPSRVLGLINCFYGCTAFLGWFLHRWRYPDIAHGNSRRFYKVLYYWSFCYSIRWGFYGAAWIISPREGSEDAVAGALELARGLCTMLPACAVAVVGRDRLFKIVGHSFDKDGARLRRDGAFVAELLGNIPIQVGQTWWVQREAENDGYPPFDPRRCWQRGVVTEVASQSDFVVRIQEPTQSGRTSTRRSSMSTSSADSATVRMKLPTTSQGESKEDLLLQAQNDLRCVEFENLSLELMHRVDSRNQPELQAAWYALSRPVRPGETIDYFMSNSWYDNPETKWERLVEVAETFYRRNGRYPTFWLDKVCINQQKITDGLKVLPVKFMACAKVLALCGDTYLSRLWCIWELFILFAFVSEAAALNRVEFVFLGSYEAGMEMLDGMENFHVNMAHCYDPNEEARLLQVIDAVGTARFNGRVASMARMTKARLVNLEAKRRSGGSAVMKVTSSMSRSVSRSKSTALGSFAGRSTVSSTGSASDFASELL